jgi:hypothetical protein
VKGQFRKAEELGAEDTKDFFYSGNKPRYISCEFTQIDYSANFTQAKVTMLCEQNVLMPGFSGRMKVPSPSTWKLENGKWCWYVDQSALLNTPWGRMRPGASPESGAAPPPSLANIPTSADFVYKQIQLDKSVVRLKTGESAEVTITNSAPGPMSVSVPAALPGLEAKLDRGTLPAGGKATLTLRAAKGAKSGVLNVQVEPTMQLLPLQITIVE